MVCPICKSEVHSGSMFCGNCGARLGEKNIKSEKKNRLTPAFIVILVVVIVGAVFASAKLNRDNAPTETEVIWETEWLLTRIQCVDESYKIISETSIGYDQYGRISEYVPYNNPFYDFVYDEEGRIISAKRMETEISAMSKVEYTYTYEYDSNGNRIKEFKTDESGVTDTYTYVYDEHNNLIREKKIAGKNPEDTFYGSYERIIDITYENGKRIEERSSINHNLSEETKVKTASDGRLYYEWIKRYEYDENDRLFSVKTYIIDIASDYPIYDHGFEYGLYSNDLYTYEEILVREK